MTLLETICSIIRHEKTPWTQGADSSTIQSFLDAGGYHGVLPLLGAEFGSGDGFETWPRDILAACRKSMLGQAMQELAQRREITHVIEALAAVGVSPLVLKGSALAYSHYPNPALRPRADTDLLIPPTTREQAGRALSALGYCKGEGVEGEFASYQATWSHQAGKGIAPYLDVHWRINNSQILASAMSYDELAGRAVSLSAFGVHARAPSSVDALLFACIHRAGHANAPYYDDDIPHFGDRAIWLYDIHLLFSRMSDAEQDEFASLAATKRIKAICRDALQRTQEWFATTIPSRIVDALNAPGPREPSAQYFSGGRLRQMIGDFLAFDNWHDRGRWLAEHAFPSERYMRAKYSGAANSPLPVLYLHRATAGIVRMIFPRRSGPGH